MTIVATDSGLGGMSVVAELVARLRSSPQLDDARVVFFNARPDAGGFNSMEPQRQVRVFDRALRCMCERHQPDALLIACHTLCAVYPQTDFARQPPVPVHGIVELSSRIIHDRLARDRDSRAILLATPITHRSGVYRQALAARGIDGSRLLAIEARALAGAIERGLDQPRTQTIINEAAQRVRDMTDDPDRPHLLCLLCTHYPYATDAIRRAIESRGVRITDVVNPNAQMAIEFLDALAPARHGAPPTRVEARVEAQVVHDAATKASIIPLLEQRCPVTAAALRDDVHVPKLFAID